MSQFFYAPNCMVKIPVVYDKISEKDKSHTHDDTIEKFGLDPDVFGIKPPGEDISETTMDFTSVSDYSTGLKPGRTTVWQGGWRWEVDMSYRAFDLLFNSEMADATEKFKEICRGNT